MTNGVGVATTIIDIALVYIYKIRVEKQNKSYNFNFQIEIKNIIAVVFKTGTIRMKECERRLCGTFSYQSSPIHCHHIQAYKYS